MNCHECARDGLEQAAMAECRFCHVALCKTHLVTSFTGAIFPQYACNHHPERAFPSVAAPAKRHLAAVAR